VEGDPSYTDRKIKSEEKTRGAEGHVYFLKKEDKKTRNKKERHYETRRSYEKNSEKKLPEGRANGTI